MQPNVKEDLIKVLKNSIKAIKTNNLVELRKQSNRTVHNSSIYQDRYSVSVSVVLFALAKVLQKEEYNENWQKSRKHILEGLNIAKNSIRKNKPYLLSKSLKKIIAELKKLDKQAGQFMQEAIETAKVKKAFNIYRHGISVGKAADLLGISKWDLLPYLGQSRDSEASQSKPVLERIKIAEQLFNVK